MSRRYPLACPSLRDVVACVCICLNHVNTFAIVLSLNTLFVDWQRAFSTDRGTTTSVQALCMAFANGGGLLGGLLERKLGQRMSLLLGSFLSTVGLITGGLCHSISMLVVPFLFRFFTDTYSWRGCLWLSGGLVLHSAFFSILLTSPLLRSSKVTHTAPGRQLTSSEAEGLERINAPDHTSCSDGDVDKTSAIRVIVESTSLRNDVDVNVVVDDSDADDDDDDVMRKDRSLCSIQFISVSERVTVCEDKSSSTPGFDTKWTGEDAAKVDSEEEDPSTNITLSRAEKDPSNSREKKAGWAETLGSRGRKWYQHFRFLSSALYICVATSTFLSIGMNSAFIFLTLDFSVYRGWSLSDGLFLNSMLMGSSLISRALILFMSLHPRFNCVLCQGTTCLIGGLALGLLGQVSSFAPTACLFAGMGVCFAGTISMFPPSILKAIGDRHFPLGMGLCLTLIGVSSMVCSALAGFLIDKQGSYSLTSLIYGFSIFTASVVLLVVSKCCRSSVQTP